MPSVAEKNFLATVKGLDMYGVDPHPCKVGQMERKLPLCHGQHFHCSKRSPISYA